MWPNPQFPADLVTFTEKSIMQKFIFCAVIIPYYSGYITIQQLKWTNREYNMTLKTQLVQRRLKTHYAILIWVMWQ